MYGDAAEGRDATKPMGANRRRAGLPVNERRHVSYRTVALVPAGPVLHSPVVTAVLPVSATAPEPGPVARAAAVLRAGGLVGLPTETVYGLAVDARDAAAVRRVFAAKGRPPDNPLIVHVADVAGLEAVARRVPPLALELAARWWPGPLTVVVDAARDLPAVTTGGLDSVAVRVPSHPVALAVLRASGLALAAPSANRSGRPSPTSAAHVVADLDGDVDLVLDAGPSTLGVESTVVDARGAVPVVLRAGWVTAADLALPAGAGPAAGDGRDAAPGTGTGTGDPGTHGDAGASPGTRYRHYAPRCRVDVAPVGGGARRAAALRDAGLAVGLVAPPAAAVPGVRVLAAPADTTALAAILYAALRRAEDAAVDVVVVEAVPETGLGAAVMDRLRRAAAREGATGGTSAQDPEEGR